jgi:starch phosphorylase
MSNHSKDFKPLFAYLGMGAFLGDPYIPTYSGGLEILGGDILRSYADLRIPVVAAIQASNSGYFRQYINEHGWQIEKPIHWEALTTLGRIDKEVIIRNEGRDLHVTASPYNIVGETDFSIPVYLLNTQLPENNPEDREITGMLYDANSKYRISQENVLGQGGVKILRELGYDIPIYHMNEGHAAFATIELLNYFGDESEVKKRCVFTTHTPVEAGHDRWDYGVAGYILGHFLPRNIAKFAGDDKLNMTKLALSLSRKVNAVSRRHMEVCREMDVFKGKDIDYVTNGIHPRTWASEPMQKMFDSNFKYWSLDPRILEDLNHVSDDEVLEAKNSAKRHLIGYVNAYYPVKFRQDHLTLVWARRFTEYKRPDLLLRDEAKLNRIAEKYGPIQIIYSGKSHPADEGGKRLIQKIYQNSKGSNKIIKKIFIEDYNTDIAKMLTGGADVWLNNPRRPLEACGTSGMKAALNGCINLSVYDGWVVEGYEMNPGGIFLVGPKADQTSVNPDFYKDDETDANGLYESLEQIADIHYNHKNELPKMMKESISLISYFNTHRMAKEYADKILGIKVY